MSAVREIELEGHIIDSLVLTRVFDTIMDMEGSFEVLDFHIGEHKEDASYSRILVEGRDEEHLDEVLSRLHRFGANLPEIRDAEWVEAPADRVVPEGFYSTTNHRTYVRVDGQWTEVEGMEMDCTVVVDGDGAVCKPVGDVEVGDRVVTGEVGIRVVPPERPRRHSVFEFMGSKVSSEKPSETMVEQVASEIDRVRSEGGKIVVVAGPAVVHTGAADELARMVRAGYVDALLTGNGFAVHDIERSLYGTSLGIDLDENEAVGGGHKHHIYAISNMVRHGSIEGAVEAGALEEGVMYECVSNGVPFVLAGSIRDDGPLPDTVTDAMEAQDAIREQVRDADMVVMLASMLHSIATGNVLPSWVKIVCVDINQATVTKLMDRGTAQAIGVVTDVGVFLPELAERLLE
ncbi:MAG: hypothetical protein MAG715_00142 [Methanonatronarchaeales archaeon]|nr:hypothetical protein [Methanonatronarchaeales archaeon]